ncbi:Flap endonuclease GEN-like [Actinidia chinensis var. chinensis]|uniref:Flap endonuclease GEN-like 1 n=1 Tax=Actinidia chinensis var. chinensis TaxID=1590841 RepID=A0A2R6QP73_ACTCC|nr:Flap endonuclease GEN-like [Actinidia chinensis var. chinensis]
MGVGGHFWDLLKPYARTEDFDFLRDKRVAVDLSFWIVQHETAIRAHTRNPHLRLTFFRTINLFSKFGAFPVFVVDGTPSPLKSQTRIARFFRASGIDLSSLPVAEEGISVERNRAFVKCIKECVELLELLGMPILKAKGEAEALCAQLNKEGQVDACITSDSDAFLFGAHCVVKHIRPNSKEPFECYNISHVEAGIGLKRRHLIAISLLVGNDHDLNGVQGIGIDTALRFVKCFSEDEILTRLSEIGRGNTLPFQYLGDSVPSSHKNSPKKKIPHCSLCGHPGSKKVHLKLACDNCSSSTRDGCMQKPVGFKCNCSSCDLDRISKEQKKNENWQIKVCQKIAMEQNFPNAEIVEMYLSNNNGDFSGGGPNLAWKSPQTEMLIDYLAFYQHWDPSYIRQRMLPMLSTIFLREMASNSKNDLLHDQYKFDSIQRVKIRFGHQWFVVNWKKAAPAMDNTIYTVPTEDSHIQQESTDLDGCDDPLDEADIPQISLDDGCWFLSTDENMELVRAAFPEKVDQFFKEKELKEMKSKRKKSGLEAGGTPLNSESPTTRSVQLSIKEFYRSSKVLTQAKLGENLAESSENSIGSLKGKRKTSSPKLSKSVRRRLLFG